MAEAGEYLENGATSTPKRTSWIGVDYFQALRQESSADAEEFRRIPSHINNILCLRYSNDGNALAIGTADGSVGVSR
jgi:hypothetical protein